LLLDKEMCPLERGGGRLGRILMFQVMLRMQMEESG
jgi:hypothetical protein